MTLPGLDSIDLKNKKVLLRMDLDIGFDSGRYDNYRLEVAFPTLEYLIKNNCEITIIGHRGRPGGKEDVGLSLKPVSELVSNILRKRLGKKTIDNAKIQMMENLRFNPLEEANDEGFAKHLAENKDLFVNEAFSAGHRKHASIIGIPKHLPTLFGFRFIDEVENLTKVIKKPKRPLIIIIGGIKKDKINYINKLEKLVDRILVGGRLPEYFSEENELRQEGKIVIAQLIPSKEDITISSLERFVEEIKNAGTILLGGPLGKFEKEGSGQGTKSVFEAVANSSAFKISAGGETHKAISKFDLEDKFDWLSVGGGATLEFLVGGTLSGIKAVK